MICISIGLNNMLLFIKAKRIILQQKIYGLSMPEYSKHHFEILLRIWYFHSSLWSEIIFKCCFLILNDNELIIVRYHQLTIEKTSRNGSNYSKLIIWPLSLHWKASGEMIDILSDEQYFHLKIHIWDLVWLLILNYIISNYGW